MDKLDMTPEQQENGQVLKSMKFKFPVFYNGQTIEEIRWDKENTVDRFLVSGTRGQVPCPILCSVRII